MEKLFEETVGVTDIRPTEITKQQREELFLKLADEVIKYQYCKNGDRETIAYDLGKLTPNDSGFEKAKQLEDDSFLTYTFEGNFIEFLDIIDSQIYLILEENVKLWAKANDIKPKLAKGQKLLVLERLNWEQTADKIVFINGIRQLTATYVVDTDPNKKVGTIIPFETVESNCKIID